MAVCLILAFPFLVRISDWIIATDLVCEHRCMWYRHRDKYDVRPQEEENLFPFNNDSDHKADSSVRGDGTYLRSIRNPGCDIILGIYE